MLGRPPRHPPLLAQRGPSYAILGPAGLSHFEGRWPSATIEVTVGSNLLEESSSLGIPTSSRQDPNRFVAPKVLAHSKWKDEARKRAVVVHTIAGIAMP